MGWSIRFRFGLKNLSDQLEDVILRSHEVTLVIVVIEAVRTLKPAHKPRPASVGRTGTLTMLNIFNTRPRHSNNSITSWKLGRQSCSVADLAVSSVGASKDWRKISEEVGRQQNDCRQRWEDLLEDAPWDPEEEERLLLYHASLGNYQWRTLAQMCSTAEKYRSIEHVRAKLNALLDNNPSPNAAGKLLERRTSSQGKPEKEKKIQEAGKPDKKEKRKEGKPEVEEVIRKKGLARKLDHKTEGAAKKASAESTAGKPESSGKKKVKKVKFEEPTKEVADDEDQPAFVVEADSEGLPEKGEGLTFLINSYSDGLAVLQEDYEEYSD